MSFLPVPISQNQGLSENFSWKYCFAFVEACLIKNSCVFVIRVSLVGLKRSEWGMEEGKGKPEMVALFAKRSTVLLPRIPEWAGIHMSWISRSRCFADISRSLIAKMNCSLWEASGRLLLLVRSSSLRESLKVWFFIVYNIIQCGEDGQCLPGKHRG